MAAPDVEEFFLKIIQSKRRLLAGRRALPICLATLTARTSELGIPTLTLQMVYGHSEPKVTQRYSHAANSERLKRERNYDHLDELDLRGEDHQGSSL
jgi:hypothetical protein